MAHPIQGTSLSKGQCSTVATEVQTSNGEATIPQATRTPVSVDTRNAHTTGIHKRFHLRNRTALPKVRLALFSEVNFLNLTFHLVGRNFLASSTKV